MIKFLRRFAKKHHLLRDTAEETINAILVSLSKDPENKSDASYRNELISSSAVALNGLSRIKDPVKLFQNLGNAFERRGFCIYTETVKNAFNRLYLNAVKQGQEKEVLRVWQGFTNMRTKISSSKYVPKKNFKKYFSELASNSPYGKYFYPLSTPVATALASRKEIGLEFYKNLLTHSSNSVRAGVAKVLYLWPELSPEFIKQLMIGEGDSVRYNATKELVLRNYFSENELKKLVLSSDTIIMSAIKDALAYKEQVVSKTPLEELKKKLNDTNKYVALQASKEIIRRKDLPLDFLVTLTKNNNVVVKEGAYLALYHRKDISRDFVLKLLKKEKNKVTRKNIMDVLKKSLLKYNSNKKGKRKRLMDSSMRRLTKNSKRSIFKNARYLLQRAFYNRKR